MLARSFRLVTALLLPRSGRRKQVLCLAALILAGCGGAARQKGELVRGNGFSFEVPSGWHVVAGGARTSASHGPELVQVSTFPLQKPYSDALFDAVSKELSTRMHDLARQEGGTASESGTVTAGGVRSHSYRVTAGSYVDEYTFVLRGKREYQLLCRRNTSSGESFCNGLIRTFSAA